MITQVIASNLYANKGTTNLNWFYKSLIKLTPSSNKYNFEGIYYFLEGNIALAIRSLIKQLKITPSHNQAYKNLSFISSNYCSKEENQWLLDELNKGNLNSRFFLKLRLSILLSLDKVKAIKLINKNYIDEWIIPSTIKKIEKPILFFHLPKCGGTTTTNALYNYFYDSKLDCLPSYTESNLLNYCIEQCHDVFPFLSSKHLGLDKIKVDFDNFNSFTIIRDPLDRNISAFRQSYTGTQHGRAFKMIPKYGSYWNYSQCTTLRKWIDLTPKVELLKQVSTFSPSLDINEFNKTIKLLKHVIHLKKFDAQRMEIVLNDIGIKSSNIIDFNKKLNKSNKRIKIPDADYSYAKEYFSVYTELFGKCIEG